MSNVYIQIYERVIELSEEINGLYDIDPMINIKIDKSAGVFTGECTTTYKKPAMYIDLFIPSNIITFGKKNKTTLDMILIHEYCHYMKALKLCANDRQKDSDDYTKYISERKQDERKTWRQTKALALQLGLWNKMFFKSLRTYVYSSDIYY